MASPETFNPLITGFLSILIAIGAAVFWITYKIRGLEKDVIRFQKDVEAVSKRVTWIERLAMIRSFMKQEDVIKEIEKEKDDE